MVGMIGSYIGRELLRRGCHVHGIVRFRCSLATRCCVRFFTTHFLRLCSTHWGNMHGLLGHSKVTLHTVIRAISSLFLCVIPQPQGDITDENFVQSVVEKVVPNPAASFISPSPSRLALILFSIWPLRCACRMIPRLFRFRRRQHLPLCRV